MIPVKVSLRNFLCYRTPGDEPPVEFDFDGSPLWSISGDNGAGKSAIFDALTYALYGCHRGGKQGDARLISSGANACEVCFEFQLDGHLYRIHRTIGRPRRGGQEPKSRQAAWFDPSVGDWRPEMGTESDRGLTEWIEHKLKMGYETFAASVLLQQGQSDKLILAKPKDRFDILSGLLDLTPYRRIEEKARERAKEARQQVRQLDEQLRTLPRIGDAEVGAAEEAEREHRAEMSRAGAQVTRAALVLEGARQYARLLEDLAAAQDELKEVDDLLADAERIRTDFNEWQLLSAAVPVLRGALEDLESAAQKDATAAERRAEAEAIDLGGHQRAAEEGIAAEEEAGRRLEELRRAYEAHAEAVSPLRGVLGSREELDRRLTARMATGDPAVWEEELGQRRDALDRAEKALEDAEHDHAECLEKSADARAQLQHTAEQLAAREAARDEAVCSRCGQSVTPAHAAREIAAAREAAAAARRAFEEAAEVLADAAGRLAEAREHVEAAAQGVTEARKGADAASAAGIEYRQAQEVLEAALIDISDVPPALAGPILESPLEHARVALADLRDRVAALRDGRKAAVSEAEKARRARAEAEERRRTATDDRRRLLAEADVLEEGARGLRQQAEVRLTGVGTEWRERALARDETVVAGLERRRDALAGIGDRHGALQGAETRRERLGAAIERIESEIDRVPAEHRVAVAEADEAHQGAEKAAACAQERWREAQKEFERLCGQREQRCRLEKRAAEADCRRALHTRLGELLGRGGLQGMLLDEAVTGIAALANETLRRISGGNLQLEIERTAGGAGDEEILIRSRDLASSADPLDVQFISGSQRFRTSVALAAAIGQYARRGTSERALIIDEGFGSLDSRGRGEMIEELRALSQAMDRVIVVSHQEDFQDRTLFPTGFVLRKVDQRTEVERFV